VTPTLLLRQTWTLADFDDQTRAATLLIAAAQIWSAATEKFAKNSKAQSNPVTDAVAKLLAYYSKYMQAISPESSVSKTAIALGTAYIEEARLKDVPRKYSLPGLTDAQLNLQLAAFGTFSAVPGKLVAPPETKKDLPQRPPVKASLPKSTSDHAPTERGPAEVKATVARRAQSTSQPPAAATTATESASPAAKKYVITRESGSSVSTLRDALFNAHNKGESGSITLFSGSKYSGQVVYGTMRLETVGLMDLSKGEKFNIPLKDIQKLELPGAGS
jgi:hypothetical protein